MKPLDGVTTKKNLTKEKLLSKEIMQQIKSARRSSSIKIDPTGKKSDNCLTVGKHLKLSDEDNHDLNDEQYLSKQLTQPFPGKSISTTMLNKKTTIFQKLDTFANDTVFEETENSVDSLETD